MLADMQRPPRLPKAHHWLACYVMISRARSLDGFLIVRPATRQELSERPPQYLLDELARLEEVERKSLTELRSIIDALPCDVPDFVRRLFAPDALQQEYDVVAASRGLPSKLLKPSRRLNTKTKCASAKTDWGGFDGRFHAFTNVALA